MSPKPEQGLTELRASLALTRIEKRLGDGLESAYEQLGSLASALKAIDPKMQCIDMHSRLKQEVNRSYEK